MKHPGLKRNKFVLEKKYLNGEDITKEDSDAVCPDAELQIQEGEFHSVWVNSKILEHHGITDDTPASRASLRSMSGSTRFCARWTGRAGCPFILTAAM